jgi:adhesin transport system membrane fusion protein
MSNAAPQKPALKTPEAPPAKVSSKKGSAATTGNDLDRLLLTRLRPGIRRLSWVVMTLLALFFGWASVAQLDEVSSAEGEITPQGKVKVIQHLEGGLITDIYVQEGDLVQEGAPLMLLDLAAGGLNQEEMQVRIDSLRLSHARLTAEANRKPLVFPAEESARRPTLVAAEQQAYQARMSELEATLAVLHHQISQRESELRELAARERSTASNLRLSRRKLGMSASLLADGLIAKMDHLQLQSETELLQGELDSITEAKPRAQAALAEANGRLTEETLRFQREAREQLSEVELNLARTMELQIKADDQQNRTEIRSPIVGVVKNMRYNTLGGVIKPGEAIMDIVPSQDNLIVDARLNPVDRGYVTVGQQATVKISTYDYARYGGLAGTVTQVAPDSTTPENAAPYFRVLVTLDKYYLGDKEGEYAITPGMQATVDIHTGTRSVLEYLIKPVLKIRDEGFRER